MGHWEHALVDELDVYTVADFQEITAADADGLGLKKMERRRLERLLETMRHGNQCGGAAEKEEEAEEKEAIAAGKQGGPGGKGASIGKRDGGRKGSEKGKELEKGKGEEKVKEKEVSEQHDIGRKGAAPAGKKGGYDAAQKGALKGGSVPELFVQAAQEAYQQFRTKNRGDGANVWLPDWHSRYSLLGSQDLFLRRCFRVAWIGERKFVCVAPALFWR